MSKNTDWGDPHSGKEVSHFRDTPPPLETDPLKTNGLCECAMRCGIGGMPLPRMSNKWNKPVHFQQHRSTLLECLFARLIHKQHNKPAGLKLAECKQ